MNDMDNPKELLPQKELETLRDRLRYYIGLKNMTQREFMEHTKVALGMLNDNARLSSIKKIIAEFPELNLYWLIWGRDYEMIKDSAPVEKLKEEIKLLKIDLKVKEGMIEYFKQLLNEKMKNE